MGCVSSAGFSEGAQWSQHWAGLLSHRCCSGRAGGDERTGGQGPDKEIAASLEKKLQDLQGRAQAGADLDTAKEIFSGPFILWAEKPKQSSRDREGHHGGPDPSSNSLSNAKSRFELPSKPLVLSQIFLLSSQHKNEQESLIQAQQGQISAPPPPSETGQKIKSENVLTPFETF